MTKEEFIDLVWSAMNLAVQHANYYASVEYIPKKVIDQHRISEDEAVAKIVEAACKSVR